MYCRNRIYINKNEQQRMRDFKIVFGGLGLGSVIAECALRMGFETLHLIDGDSVELSNLNRQNYTQNDIGKPKCEALYRRLKQINPNANITYSNVYLTAENLCEHLTGADIAINAIDFTSSAPLIFDDVCFAMNIPVVHPYNLGYGGLACVLTKESANLRSLSQTFEGMEINVANHVLNVLEKKGLYINAFKDMLTEYIAEQGKEQPPQLSIGAWLLGGLCTDIFLKILRNKQIFIFPDFYYLDSKLNHFNP
ncbi:MAG: ThiF family adenylyltransferase [Bacteroidales bacterium]|nr:ThiF family adenylyltransferase [Bacteroidales bacterium]